MKDRFSKENDKIKELRWQEIHTRNKIKREKTRPDRLKARRLGLIRKKRLEESRATLSVPEHFNLESNYEECINFIEDIKSIIFDKKEFVFLNFRRCKSISSEGCVLLAAEIDRCLKLVEKSVLGNYPSEFEVYFSLNELGFFKMLKIKGSPAFFDNIDDVEVLDLASGSDNPKHLMKGVKELFVEDGDKDSLKSKYSREIFGALTEAMGNSVEHAYPDNFLKDNTGRCIAKWWRAGFKDEDTNKLVLVLYDQGAGIPNTLTKNWKERLESFISSLTRNPYDDELLNLAMELGRSRTRVEGRGQGSYDIQQLIRESKDGMLKILSYKGSYTFKSNGEWKSSPLPVAIKGTMITWNICLNS